MNVLLYFLYFLNVLFIEFDPLCQKLWASLSNSGIFYACSPNMVMSHDPRSKFRKSLCFLISAFNIKKSYKISSRKALYFKSYQPKTSWGGGGWKTPPKHFWAKQKRKQIFAAFTDFEKAFDTVWRCALLYKRLKAGIHSRMFNMIKSMYEETYCSVKCKDDLVKPF